jgi:hypothetical protein
MPKAIVQGTSWTARLILLAFVLTIFEGAVRKWFVGTIPILRYGMYFSKDFVFFLAAVPAFNKFTKLRQLAFGVLLPISFGLLLLPTVINLPKSNPVGMLLSLRAYLILPVCAFLAAGMIKSARDADRIAYVIGICTFFVAALGVQQYMLPATHWLNRYETGEETMRIASEFSHVRATGTFAFITGMSFMAGVASWAGIYLFLSGSNPIRRLFAVATMGAGLLCATVAMSRGGAYFCAITVVGAVVLFRRVKEMIFLGVIAILAYTFFVSSGEGTDEGGGGITAEIGKGLTGRLTQREGLSDRAGYALQNLYLGVSGHPMGEGLGVGQVGGNFISTGKASWGGGYETELGRVAFEVGVLGLIGVFLWRIAALREMWRRLSTSQDPKARALLAASMPLFAILAVNSMSFNHTASSFAWAIVAVALGVALAAGESVPAVRPRRRPPALAR